MSLNNGIQDRRQWIDNRQTYLQQIIRDLKADSAGVVPGNAEPATKRNSTVAHRYVRPTSMYWPGA
jgi:hypothetical protein